MYKGKRGSYSRKSQVSVFIILGILLIVGILLYFVIIARVEDSNRASQAAGAKEVPSELLPVAQYVSACNEKTSMDAIKKIGSQGGYIYTDSLIANEADATMANSVMFTPKTKTILPYWWYLKSDNDCVGECVFASERPELYRSRMGDNSIEDQMDRFITEKLRVCIAGFEPLKRSGFVIEETGDIEVSSNIAERDVSFNIKYPLKVRYRGADYRIQDFYVTHTVGLKRMYELATFITNMESQYHYLEKDVLNLIVVFSSVDPNMLPPMADYKFEFANYVVWQKSKVKEKVEQMLESTVQLLQVDGTLNYEYRSFPDSKLKEALFNRQMLIPVNQTYPELSVNFNYLRWWPIYFDLNCDGELCSPISANNPLFTLVGIHQYNFVYDLSFPVFVQIRDPDAFKGEGFSFNFFLESNIRNNKYLNTTFNEPLTVSYPVGTMLCDANKKNSGNVTIKVTDAHGKAIEDATVGYTCGKETCVVGTTDAEGKVVERLPICLGGIIAVTSDGYASKSYFLDTEKGKAGKLDAKLEKFYTKNLVIKKKKIVKSEGSWVFMPNAVDLDPKEEALISLERKSDYVGDQDFTAFGSSGTSTIKIMEGTYAAQGFLTLNDRIMIPEETRKEGVWPLQTEITIPKMEFNQSFPSGGVSGLSWKFTREDLEKFDTIEIYLISTDIAGIPEQDRKMEDLEQTSKIEEYSSSYYQDLNPLLR